MTPARAVMGPCWAGCRCAAKNIVLALPAQVEVAVGDQRLVVQGGRLGYDQAIRVHDARAADQARTVLIACLGHGDRPGGVHVGSRLCDELGMIGPQRGVLRRAAIGITGGRVVADADQLHPLQAEHAPELRPSAVVADHHAHDRALPGAARTGSGEAEIAVFKAALLKLLEPRAGPRLDRAGQVDFWDLPGFGGFPALCPELRPHRLTANGVGGDRVRFPGPCSVLTRKRPRTAPPANSWRCSIAAPGPAERRNRLKNSGCAFR